MVVNTITGVELVICDTVERALDTLRQIPRAGAQPIVITDLGVPGKSGFDFLAEIRQDENLSSLPVIVLTANEDPVQRRKAQKMGCNAFLIKPLELDELAKMLRKVIRDWSVPPPATIKDGRYALGHLLGRGGAAAVYLCHDTWMQVDRAIKLVPRRSPENDLYHRVRTEAEAMAALSHPNVLRVYDVGSSPGFDFVVIEYAPGGTLQDRLDEVGQFGVEEACFWILPILDALALAHAQGILHRDIKPQNVLISADGQPLLSDFGIARLNNSLQHTATGVALGSIAFMPPEQRLDAAQVDETADVYSVGATLYNLVTNQPPIDLYMEPPNSKRFAEIRPALTKIIVKACAKRAEHRYASIVELRQAILDLSKDEPLPPLDDPTPTLVEDLNPPPPAGLAPTTTTGDTMHPEPVADEDSPEPSPTSAEPTPAPKPRKIPPNAGLQPAPPSKPAPYRLLLAGVGVVLLIIVIVLLFQATA